MKNTHLYMFILQNILPANTQGRTFFVILHILKHQIDYIIPHWSGIYSNKNSRKSTIYFLLSSHITIVIITMVTKLSTSHLLRLVRNGALLCDNLSCICHTRVVLISSKFIKLPKNTSSRPHWKRKTKKSLLSILSRFFSIVN